jgi:glycogen operon protein
VLRTRQIRNLLATLLLSQGVPMLLAGDEIGRTQNGNNNAYCQDNEISWIDWRHADYELFAFVQRLIALRQAQRVFRNPHFSVNEIRWYRTDGQPMNACDWNTPWARAVAMFLDGSCGRKPADDFYIAFNSHCGRLDFTIPPELGSSWRVVLYTASRDMRAASSTTHRVAFHLEAHSMLAAVRVRRNLKNV